MTESSRIFSDFAEPINYATLLANVGRKVNIINGKIALDDEDGFATISLNYELNTLYLNELNQTYTFVLPEDELRGRYYLFMRADCNTIVFRYLDNLHGTKFMKAYQMTDRATFEQNKLDSREWLLSFGLTQVPVEDLRDGDIVMIQLLDPNIYSHLGVYKDGVVYTHRVRQYSGVEPLNRAAIQAVFRYA